MRTFGVKTVRPACKVPFVFVGRVPTFNCPRNLSESFFVRGIAVWVLVAPSIRSLFNFSMGELGDFYLRKLKEPTEKSGQSATWMGLRRAGSRDHSDVLEDSGHSACVFL
jgi:hypothetical protein